MLCTQVRGLGAPSRPHPRPVSFRQQRGSPFPQLSVQYFFLKDAFEPRGQGSFCGEGEGESVGLTRAERGEAFRELVRPFTSQMGKLRS